MTFDTSFEEDSMTVIYTVEILASFLENILGMILTAKILKRDGFSKRKERWIASMILTGFVWSANQIHIFSPFLSVIGVILLTACVCIIFSTKMLDTMPLIGLYMLLIYIGDFLALALLGTIFVNPEFAIYSTTHFSYERTIFIILSKLILVVVASFIGKYTQTITYNKKDAWFGLLLGSAIVPYFINTIYVQADMEMFLMLLLFLIAICLGVYIVVQRIIAKNQEEKIEIEREKNRMLAENYKLFVINYRSNQIFFHDLKNQHMMILEYLESGKYEKAKDFLSSMNQAQYLSDMVQYTGMEALDILLAYKKNMANLSGVSMNIIAEAVKLKLTEPEMVTLFGNLLDNAIEANNDVDKDLKHVLVIIRKIRDMVIIKITNPFAKEPQIENGQFITNKGNKGMHGLGLQSVRHIVEAYGASMEVDYQNGQFSVVIMFTD